jgi:hypothetical protein
VLKIKHALEKAADDLDNGPDLGTDQPRNVNQARVQEHPPGLGHGPLRHWHTAAWPCCRLGSMAGGQPTVTYGNFNESIETGLALSKERSAGAQAAFGPSS